MNVGFLGAGHIARALAEGWSRPGRDTAPRLAFFDVLPEKAAELAAAVGGEAVPSAAALVAASDVIVVAVRPQHVGPLLAEIGPLLGERLLISVAAGVSLGRLRAAVPEHSSVARVMPNGAAALGLGVFLFVPGTLPPAARDAVHALLSSAGTVLVLDEQLFDVATAVAGCMPGLLAAFVAHAAAVAENEGLAAADARMLAIEGVHGAAALIAREGDPGAVIAAAATPGGMTAAGVDALEAGGLGAAVSAGVLAAARRAKELA